MSTIALFDSSVWVALAFDHHPAHAKARQALESADSARPIAFCRATQQSFLRLITTPALHKLYNSLPLSNDQAWGVFEQLSQLPQVTWLDEPSGLSAQWQTYARLNLPAPKAWMDAYLAAFARMGKIELVSLDKDFQNFRGITLKLL